MSQLMLIDGNSLAYRAFHALRAARMSTDSGQLTGAVFGFTSMLVNLWREHSPEQIVVAFDRPEPTFRHEIAPDYKANRPATPDSLIEQLAIIRDVVSALAIPAVDAVGYEADDVIATLAAEGRDAGRDVIIVTGDRDCYQLVEDPLVKVLYNRRGVSDYMLYDEAGIKERTGVSPSDYVDYAALRGDKSDNLPGVPGVGEKTAARLINDNGDLDGVFASLDCIGGLKLRENLAAAEERVRGNAELMRLVRDVPLEAGLEDLSPGELDAAALIKLLDSLEFHSLKSRLAEVLGDDLKGWEAELEELEPVVRCLKTAGEAVGALLAAGAADGPTLALGTPSEGLETGLALVVDSAEREAVFIPGGLLHDKDVTRALAAVVGDKPGGEAADDRPVDSVGEPAEVLHAIGVRTADSGDAGERMGGEVTLALHDAKALMRGLLEIGVDMRAPVLDTTLAAYLVNPSAYRYELDELAMRHAGLTRPAAAPQQATAPREDQRSFDFGAPAEAGVSTDGALPAGGGAPADEAAWSALAVDRLVRPLCEKLESQGLSDLYAELEMPLVRVLARMEHIGIGVDRSRLERIRGKLTAEAGRLRGGIIAAAGRDVNVNSPKQLSAVLFDDLSLTPVKRTKTGFSTDAQTLERLRGEHPIIDLIQEYREVEKLRSTYAEGLLGAVGPDGRIHATFNQTVARTGRLSSDDPNLHNIPIRTDRGRVFRTAFTAREGCRLLVADYDQIELRCIAHLSEDPRLISAFHSGEDVHTTIAAWLFGIEPADVGFKNRATAKMLSYGLIYGMEAYGLGKRLNIPTRKAAGILEDYFAAFPSVRSYIDSTVEEARRRGYTETLFGRRRHIPELASRDQRLRQAGERQAMNTGVQGLAADIFKLALVRLDGSLEAGGFASRIVLQVHDEIIIESPDSELEEVSEKVEDVMRGACDLSVPLAVHLTSALTWADAKS